MKLINTYHGGDDRFEGDLTLWLRSLPDGARVRRATVSITPAAPDSERKFEEVITFPNTLDPVVVGDLGATKVKRSNFVEVDFHARRTLARVAGSGGTSTLQVDIGGAYIGVADDGTFGPDKPAWSVTLSDSEEELPGLTVNKFGLSAPQDPANPEDTTLDVTKVTVRSVPTNVSVRLGQMAPFWTRLGELTIGETSPDFADVLSAFLAEAQIENGFYTIPLVVHSDTIARLDVTLDIDYVIEQPVLPPHLPEVTIPYNFSTVPGMDEALTTVSLPRGAIPVSGRTGAQVRGEFEPTRVASGPIGEEPTTFPILVSPECALAQPLESGIEIAVTGIDLPLANTQPGLAGLHVAIQSDADGKPSGEVLTNAEVRVEKPLPGQSAWGSATLPAEFRVLPGVRYWLALQSQVGQAYWNVIPGTADEPALQSSRDGGLSWRMSTEPGVTAPLAALFRLRDTPDLFTVPVQLQIGKGAHAVRRRLDEFAPLGRVEFSFDLAEKLEEYLAGPAVVSPCGTGELLTNGGFDEPPHDDATRRLFGFDAGGAWVLIGSVDLSRGANLAVQRFIHLSVDGKLPIRIDCAGANPSHTNFNEIIDAINRAVGDEVASEYIINKKIYTGRLRIESPSGDGGRFELHPWRQAIVPQGWECPPEARGQIWRLKLPTITYSSPGADSPGTWRPERIVVAMEAAGDKPVMLIQSLPVAGGCAYALRFLFRTCVDFRRRPASTGPNPRIEQDVTFEVLDVYDNPLAQTHIEDLGRGIQGLNCGHGLEISLSLASPFVELTLTTGPCPKVEVEAFEDDMSVGTTKMSGDGQIPQSLRLTGTRITRVVVRNSFQSTLLHKFCFADRSLCEVRWLDEEGQLINSESEKLDTRDQFFPEIDGMLQSEVRLVAPSGAAQAEIRFIQPPSGIVFFLDDVSLTPTSETLRNSNFQQWEVESADQLSPVGWTRLGGWLDPALDDGTGLILAKLGGGGPEETVVTQPMEVVGEERYELRVRAWPVSPPADDAETRQLQQRARLELHWLADGPLGDPVILPLDGRGFPSYVWAGTTPSGATRAEIRLIQPRSRGNLIVESVSFERADLVPVPLIFLGEAPGELTVSDLRVTYDLPEPPTPPEEALPVTVAAAEVSPVVSAPRLLTLADAAIGIVAGVGERFSGFLNSQRITTIADLAALDPEAEIADIPPERRLELKTAAEMIMALDMEAAAFAVLADESLDALLMLPPADLARRSGQPPERAELLQRNLRALRLLLKNDDFRSLRLSDLMPGRL